MEKLGYDYMPHPDEDFDSWQKGFVSIASANATALGISTTEITNLVTLQTAWNTAFAVGGKGQKSTRTSQQTKAKNIARKPFEKALRVFVKRWIIPNPAVSDALRVALRVTVTDTVRTRSAKPVTVPMIDILTSKGNTLLLSFRQQADAAGRSHRGKPKHMHGMRIYYKVGDPAPASVADCNKFATSTRSPLKLTFTAANAGNKLYGFGCWIDNLEEEGPFTAMFVAVIPL